LKGRLKRSAKHVTIPKVPCYTAFTLHKGEIMPKMKSHKGAQQRFKITATGKVLRTKGQKSHLRRRKSRRVKQLYDKSLPMSPALAHHIHAALPYGLPD
jgi:large subunit ribosomal protein L35